MKDINLYLVRHGQTEWNLKDQMQGSKNSPLTDNGILGAKITGQHLKNTPFIKAYSSPQQRAVETRDYILEQFDQPLATFEHNGLKEMDFGIWEGQHVPTLLQTAEFASFINDPSNFDPTFNQGESYHDVLVRMQKSLDDIIAVTTEQTGNILVVSHGNALRILLCVLKGGDWRRHREQEYSPRILNTSISVVNYRQLSGQDKGQYLVRLFNDVDHIPTN